MTEGKLRGMIDSADRSFSSHLKEANAKTATESCGECRYFQGKLAAFEEVRQVIKSERRKQAKRRAK